MADIKKIFAAMTCALAAMILFVSCEKDDENDSTYMGLQTQVVVKTNQKLCYEDMHHVADFDTTANKLYTVDQFVDGNIVVRENGNKVSTTPFGYELNLETTFSANPSTVYVLNKENLSSVAMTSSTASDEKTGVQKKEGDFQIDSTSRSYEFNFNEGETVEVKSYFEKLSHKDTTFAYAEVKNVSYKEYDATLNEAISNADSTVYDINLYFGVEVVCNANSDLNKTYKVRVPVRRIFKEAPAEAVTEIADVEHKAQFDTTANKLFTVEQYVAGDFVTTLRGEEIGRKPFKYDLNLEAAFTSEPSVVYVDAEPKLSEVALKSSNAGEMAVATSEKDDFVVTSTSRSYEFNFNEGETVEVKSVFEKLTNADTEFAYAEIKSVSYKNYEAKKNEGESDADKTVYDIDLYFGVEVVCNANSDLNETYVVRVPIKRIFAPEKPDTFETVLENLGYVGEFDTKTKELYTVEQNVTGDWVTYKNNEEEVSRESFERDINLEAIFDVPEVVYVDSELSLSDVKLTASTRDGDVVRRRTDAGFTTTTTSINHNFRFNENEKVVSATSYEKETYGEEEFVYSSISTVSYKRYEAKKNEMKSNADSTVYDVVLYFDVTVKREGEVLTRSSDTQAHTVAVPYMRVYKHVAPSLKDEFVKKSYRDVTREILSSTTEKVSFTEYEVWSLSGEKNAKTISKVLNFGFSSPSKQTVYTENTDYATKSNGSVAGNETSAKDGNWTVYTKTNSYSSTANNGHKSFDNKYSYNSQKAVYKNEYYTVEFGYGSWSVNEGNSTVGAKSGETTYNGTVYEVYPYVNNVSYEYDVETDSYNGSAKANTDVCVEKPEEDKLVKKSYRDVTREILSSTTEKVSFTEYEVWSVSGEKNAKTISKVLSFGFSSPSKQTVYTENTDYQTRSNGSVSGNETSSKDGNWTVYTKTNSYSSTADNGHKSFNNKYSYNSQKAVYKNEYYTVEFGYGSWSVNEGNSTVGNKSGETTYNGTVYEVYPYVNNVSYVYDVTTDSYNGSAKANTDVCVEKVVDEPSVLPENWGKIIGAGISAVPADDVKGSYAKKCLCIRTENGAVSIVFDMNSSLPSIDAILAGYFVEGDFGAEYNSGFFTTAKNHGDYEVGQWVPAIAKDEKKALAYYFGDTLKASVLRTTAKMWNWRNGDITTVVNGYDFAVTSNGTLTITCGNETMTIK